MLLIILNIGKQAFHIYVTDPNIEDLSKKFLKPAVNNEVKSGKL
jgi:hypothetical protein